MNGRVRIALTKSWEVECEDCGIVDVRPTREKAAEAATDHARRRHNGKASIARHWKQLAPYQQ